MARLFKPVTLLALALLSVVLVTVFGHFEAFNVSPYFFEAKLATSSDGRTQVYYDSGTGFVEQFSAWQPIAPSSELKLYRWPLPIGTIRALRFDPVDGPGTATIADVRVMRRDGATIVAFTPGDFAPQNQIARVERTSNQLTLETTPGANDPFLDVALRAPIVLIQPRAPIVISAVCKFVVVFAVSFAFLAAACAWFSQPASRAASWATRTRDYFRPRPARAIFALAALAVIVSCYPVVFLGRSYVSPNFSDGTTLLYGKFPTLPGYDDAVTTPANGSDVGAIAWQHAPYAFEEHRALFEDGEWPLWNRYNSCGTVLLGQGQTMFGDPLHLLVIAADGAAWAWDLKYLLAKLLFATGLGLIVLRGTRHLPSALLTAVSAPFIGFFLYRVNHPAFFSLCYAPWILYCWLRVAQAASLRETVAWCCGLVLANWTETNSGTAKEAYMLLFAMNFSGAVTLLAVDLRWSMKLARFAALSAAGVVFAFITAPVWLTFIDALGRSYTTYNSPAAFQIQPGLILGLFDELFYRPLEVEHRTLNPSANFLTLLGTLYALATLRRTPTDRFRLAIILSAIPPLALAFGLVPPEWITRVPFLANVAHIDNTFSCALIVLLTVFAGYGFAAASTRLAGDEARGDLLVTGSLLGAFVFAWIAMTQVVHRMPFGAGTVQTFLQFGQRLRVGPFIWLSLGALVTASVALAVTARRSLARGSWTLPGGIVAFICLFVMLWRFGLQAHIGYENYVYSPATRVDFHAKSPAIEWLKSDVSEPFRAVGISSTMFPGWSAAYNIEGINGPDALMNPRYRELIDAGGIERLWGWRIYVTPQQLVALRPFFDMFGVRYYLDLPGSSEPAEARLSRVNTADLDVYRSETAWPRAFFTDRVATYEKTADLGKIVRSGDGRPFAAMQTPGSGRPPSLATDLAHRTITPAGSYKLTTNSTSFDVTASGPGVIVLGEAWLADDFRVTVNGKAATVLRVNHAFKGVEVNAAATYHVSFAYRPRHFAISLMLAGIGACGLLGVLAFVCFGRRRS